MHIFTPSQKGNFNLSAVYDASTSSTNFTLTTLAHGSALGWLGVGTGRQMAGSNMVVMWASGASGDQLVTTQRTASGNKQPSTNSLPLAAMQVSSSTTKTGTDGTTFNWVQPGFPTQGSNMQQIEMMWAASTTAPSSSDPSSTLHMHNNNDDITFDLTKPYDGGVIAPAVGTTSGQAETSSGDGADRSMDQYNMIVFAHMVSHLAPPFGAVKSLIPTLTTSCRHS